MGFGACVLTALKQTLSVSHLSLIGYCSLTFFWLWFLVPLDSFVIELILSSTIDTLGFLFCNNKHYESFKTFFVVSITVY